MNYNITVNLSKITGAFVRELKGATATKKCVIIPVDDAGLIEGKQGIYMDMVALELQNPQYDDTHMVKLSVSSAQYKNMTDEQRKAIPIIGNMKPQHTGDTSQTTQSNPAIDQFKEDWQVDDTPF